jgi:uncharacterized membrane protein YhaH (DUF805 family)
MYSVALSGQCSGGNVNWYLTVLKKYADFSGRARRMEYWMFSLISLLIMCGLVIVDAMLGFDFGEDEIGILSGIYVLAVLIPSLAVSVRRLHDTDRSGWWVLIGIVPLIGDIVLLIFFVLDSTPGDNRFGPNPKGA